MSGAIVTIEFNEMDAFRLLFLVQREASNGRIWDDYWASLANHIRENIKLDLRVYAQIEYQETLAVWEGYPFAPPEMFKK
jgi:hypothetical protein